MTNTVKMLTALFAAAGLATVAQAQMTPEKPAEPVPAPAPAPTPEEGSTPDKAEPAPAPEAR